MNHQASLPQPSYTLNTLDSGIKVRIPNVSDISQDQEWCEILNEDTWQRIRFHDYDEIFRIPGLYEFLFYRQLHCQSPRRVTNLLTSVIDEQPDITMSDLRIVDLGAGNGMVGEQLVEAGAETLVGIDIIPEAKVAAERDRPGVYQHYHVADMTEPNHRIQREIGKIAPNCLLTVAALGFGDIPPEAFAESCNLIEQDGWVAFNIKVDFLGREDQTGFSSLIMQLLQAGIIELYASQRYVHRLSITGEPLEYIAMVVRKRGTIEKSWLAN